MTGQGTDCTGTTVLTAGQTCDVRARFNPSATGAKTASITVDSDAPDVSVALSGTGIQTLLTATPDSLSFGSKDVDDGATAGQTSVIENTGTEPVTFTGITVDSGWTRLTGNAEDCATTETLAAGEECDLRIAFDPSATGAQTGEATIDSNAPDETVALSGTGIQTELSRSPTTLPFGSQDLNEGPTATQTSTITNSGTETVTLVGISGSGDTTQFERLTGDTDDCTDTTVLAAGEDCDLRARFDPTTIGGKSATYTVDSNAADITVDVTGTGTLKALSPSPATLPFGSQDIDDGATSVQTSVVTNSGTEAITIVSVGVTGDTAHFTRLADAPTTDCTDGDVLAVNDTCNVRAQFDPTSVGAKSATVTIDSNAPDATVSLTGTGTQTELTRSPTSLTYADRDIDDGPSAAQESTVTNSGTETVDLDAVTFGGTNPTQFDQLTDEGTDCTAATTLTAGQTCKLRLRFDPSTVGAKSATVTVESNAADVSVAVSGTGIQTLLSPSPAALAFGNQNINDGATATQTSTVTNAGTEPITFTAIDMTGDTTQFARLITAGDDCTASTTLTAGQTCKVRAQFDPTATGAKSATITIDSNAADATIGLTGTGVLRPSSSAARRR